MQSGRKGGGFPANHDERDRRSKPSSSVKTRSAQSSAQDFVGFHYERPVVTPASVPYPPSTTRKSKRSNSESTMTKAEYVQASFRFIVSPLADPCESAWYTPDTLIPWETIETVVVPLNQENSLLCPICLDTVQCPRITKCGHSFCVSCLLRHMNSDRSNARKCPMCMEYVFKNDLRAVLFLADTVTGDAIHDHSLTTPVHPLHIFQVSSVSKTLEVSSGPSDTLFGNKLQVQHKFSFQHLVVSKGTCIPYLPQTQLHKIMHAGLQDVSTSSASAPAVHQQRRIPVGASSSSGSGVQPLLSQHLEQIAQTLPCYSTSPTASMSNSTAVETRYSRIMYRPLAETLSAYDLERILLIDTRAACLREGDTEVLPHLDEALELLSGRQDGLMIQLRRDFIVDIDIHSSYSSGKGLPPGLSSRMSAGSSSGHSEGNVLPYSMLDNDSLFTHLYQATSGDLIFLHPLCQRVLQQHCSQASATSGGYLPEILSGKVVDIEHLRLSSTYKQKPPHLRHLPAYTAIALVELDMKHLVSKEVYAQFAEEFVRRQNKRRDKKRLEARFHRQAQQRSQQNEDYYAQMAYAGYAGDAFSGYEEFDSSYLDALPTLQDVYIGGQLSDSSPASAGAEATIYQEADHTNAILNGTSKSSIAAPGAGFAEITQKFGNFPSLSHPQPTPPPPPLPGASPPPQTGTWGATSSKKSVSQSSPKSLVAGSSKNSLDAKRPLTNQLSAASLVRNKVTGSGRPNSLSSSNSRVTIRSAELSAATSGADGTGSGNMLAFRLEDALRNSRGKVKGSKGKSKVIVPTAAISETPPTKENAESLG